MTTSLILTLVAVFGAVALATGGAVFYVLQQTAPERRRLGRVNRPVQTGLVLDSPATLTSAQTNFYKQVTTILPKSRKEMTKLQRLLARAGYHTPTPIAVYILAQAVCPIVFGVIPFFFGPLKTVWPIMAIAGLFGWLAPGVVVGRMISKRQKIIQNGLPDALDLMIVCLEAGSGLDQAIMKVSDELDLAYPPLAEEFRMLLTETRAGKARLEAFRNLSSRTGVDDVRALVAMLVQTDRFGTSVSQALRTHAETSRTKRRQRAEEKAAKIGVKMVFPLVFCLFPAFFVVTLGPAVIKFVRVMFGQIMGQ
jgi:tight adherence protein C